MEPNKSPFSGMNFNIGLDNSNKNASLFGDIQSNNIFSGGSLFNNNNQDNEVNNHNSIL